MNKIFIEIGGGFAKSKDNFSTDSKKSISGLGKAESENSGFAYLEMFYGYDISDFYESLYCFRSRWI